MKLLVGGCSFSSGWRFTPDNIHQTWPSRLAKELGAELTNVSAPAYDNKGIFLNYVEQLVK